MKRLSVLLALVCVLNVAAVARRDPLPSWNDGADEEGDRRVRREGDEGGLARLRAAGRADRRVRQRRHALVRAADVLPVAVRPRPRQGDSRRSTRSGRSSSRSRPCSSGDHEGRSRRRRERGSSEISIAATHAGMTTDEFDDDRQGLAGDRAAPAVQAAVHRAASTSRCSSCWRTCGRTASRRSSSPAAAVEFMRPWTEKVLRHPARAGRRQQRQDEVRDARRRQAGAAEASRSVTSDRRRPRQAGRHPPHIGRRPDHGVRQLRRRPRRCSQYTTAGDGRALRAVVHHTDAEREVRLRPRSRTSAGSTRRSTRRRRTAGPSST